MGHGSPLLFAAERMAQPGLGTVPLHATGYQPRARLSAFPHATCYKPGCRLSHMPHATSYKPEVE